MSNTRERSQQKHGAAPDQGAFVEWFERLALILVWALTGPLFHYSDTWQLVINTGTTIITFLMVFIIQNTQNRDARAINLKLDELIHAIDAAKNQMMDIEKLSDEELDVIHEKYTQLRADCVDDEGEPEA